MRTPLIGILSLLMCAGCIPETGVEAPLNTTVTVPDDIELTWSDDYNAVGDGIGAVVIMDMVVMDGEDRPMDNIQVEVLSNWGGVNLIPATAVKIVQGPDAEDLGCTGESTDPDECAYTSVYDTSGDQYYQFASDVAEGFSPTYLIGATDNRGILRVFGYIDALPVAGEDSFGDVVIAVNLGVDSANILISASGG
jgi:hypothetical protein